MSQAPRSPRAKLRLSGQVKFPDAERLASQLAAMLEERPVEIDATSLEEADASIVQVMVAARRSADAKGQSLKLVFPDGGPVVDLVQRLGLETQLLATPPSV